jgi:oligoendopeptidase F
MHPPTWDLSTLGPLPGSEAFDAERTAILEAAEALRLSPTDHPDWPKALRWLFVLEDRLGQLGAAAECVRVTDTRKPGVDLSPQRRALDARGTELEAQVAALDEATLAELGTRLPGLGPQLQRLHERSQSPLSPELRTLLDETETEALHAWGALPSQLLAGTEVASRYPEDYARTTANLRPHTALGCTALSHLTAARNRRFRLEELDPIAASAKEHRLPVGVLEALGGALAALRPTLLAHLRWKARRLGRPRLRWCDLFVPVGHGTTCGWDDAVAVVRRAFARQPGLLATTDRLLAEGGIHAAPSRYREHGSRCIPLVASRTSRVSVAFDGTLHAVAMLGHELGHAWHADLIFGCRPWRRMVTGAMAETASMYTENLVLAQLLTERASEALCATVLDQAVGVLLVNEARMRFEIRLYAMRERGALDPGALETLQVNTLREAFGDTLEDYDGLLWLRKVHLFVTRSHFYNWPYVFGYLFGNAIAAVAGDAGMPDVLERTGWQDPVDLARAVAGADLTDPAFWARGSAVITHAAQALSSLDGGASPAG